MTISKETKKVRKKYWTCRILSFITTILPLLVFVVMGFANNEIHTGSKVFLGSTLICALILVLVNILKKYHLRSPLFLILLGIYYALGNILSLIVIISIGVVLDEFIFHPLAIKYKDELVANKVYDKRTL